MGEAFEASRTDDAIARDLRPRSLAEYRRTRDHDVFPAIDKPPPNEIECRHRGALLADVATRLPDVLELILGPRFPKLQRSYRELRIDIDVCLPGRHDMPMRRSLRATRYIRKSFFVDAEAIRRARKALGVGTDAEAVRLAVERVVEMEEFWRFMEGTRGRLARGSIRTP